MYFSFLITRNTTISANPIGIGASTDLKSEKKFTIAPSSSSIDISLPFNKIVGGNNVHDIGVVQLTDFFGNPVAVSNDLRIGLESSDTEVMEVPTSITIPVGKSFVKFSITTIGSVDSATISADSRGFFGSEVMLEQIPFVKQLVIFPVYPLDEVLFNEPIEISVYVDDNYATSEAGIDSDIHFIIFRCCEA